MLINRKNIWIGFAGHHVYCLCGWLNREEKDRRDRLKDAANQRELLLRDQRIAEMNRELQALRQQNMEMQRREEDRDVELAIIRAGEEEMRDLNLGGDEDLGHGD